MRDFALCLFTAFLTMAIFEIATQIKCYINRVGCCELVAVPITDEKGE
jgi:hypothetical protein